MSVFEFVWDGVKYFVEGTQYSLEYIVLPNCRKVVRITQWSDGPKPYIAGLEPIPHDMQESLPREIANEYNAAIAEIAEPKKTEILEEE